MKLRRHPFLLLILALFILTLSTTHYGASAKTVDAPQVVDNNQPSSLGVGDFFLTEDELPSPWIPYQRSYSPGAHMNLRGVFLVLMLGTIFAISRLKKRKKRRSRSAGKDGTVQDAQGRWWYQDPNSGGWSIWNGKTWQLAAQPAPNLAAPKRIPVKKQRGGSCLFSLLIGGLIALVVIGGISLVAFQFLPGYQIQMGPGDLTEILKMGGGGALVSVLGLIMLHGGLKSIITRRAIVEDDWGRRREKRGCSAVINGLGRLFFGILLLVGGLGMMTLTLYQEVLPWLGF